eukprot:2945105-Amphidinium_carterae.1
MSVSRQTHKKLSVQSSDDASMRKHRCVPIARQRQLEPREVQWQHKHCWGDAKGTPRRTSSIPKGKHHTCFHDCLLTIHTTLTKNHKQMWKPLCNSHPEPDLLTHTERHISLAGRQATSWVG